MPFFLGERGGLTSSPVPWLHYGPPTKSLSKPPFKFCFLTASRLHRGCSKVATAPHTSAAVFNKTRPIGTPLLRHRPAESASEPAHSRERFSSFSRSPGPARPGPGPCALPRSRSRTLARSLFAFLRRSVLTSTAPSSRLLWDLEPRGRLRRDFQIAASCGKRLK